MLEFAKRVDEQLAGSTVLVTGGSGFLGKAVLATLLRSAGDLRRLLVLIRAPDAAAAQRRLVEEVLTNDAFGPLADGAIPAMLEAGRIRAVVGDLETGALPGPEQEGWGEVDTVIHCAASVSFEAPLDEILELNALGPVRLLDSLRAAGSRPHFVHVSTAYAADCKTTDVVHEDGLPHPGLAGLDPEEMMAAAREWRAAAGEDSSHSLARKGRRYAVAAGWPDTYALSKALGERLLVERSERTTIVRPSIIESAIRDPYPGWLEGIKVADPLILAYAAGGLTHLPGRAGNRIDIVPVDYVANACVAAAARPPSGRVRGIAVTSTAHNPLAVGQLAGHIKAHFRREPLRRRNGAEIEIGELEFVDRKVALRKTIRRERLAEALAAASVAAPISAATRRRLRRNSVLARQVTRMVKIYGPYTELDCVFDDSNARALAATLDPADRADLPFDTGEIDWKDYLEGTHLPRVHRMAEQRVGSGPGRHEQPQPASAGSG